MTSRRDLLRSVAGGATLGLAGCASLPTFDGGGGDVRPFADWLYAPGTISDDHYPVIAVDPAAVSAVRRLVPVTTFGAWRTPVVAADPANVGMERIDRHVRFDASTVVGVGDFSLGELASGLERAGYTERSTYEGYRLFLRSVSAGEERVAGSAIHWEAVAVANGTYVAARKINRYSTTLVIEKTIDAAEGRAPRYDIESPAMGTLVDHLADGTVVTVETLERIGRPRVVPVDVRGIVAAGHGMVVDGQQTRRRVGLVFDSEAVADEAGVREWAASATPVGSDVPTRDVSLERVGATALLSWHQPLRSVTDAYALAPATALSQNDWIGRDDEVSRTDDEG